MILNHCATHKIQAIDMISTDIQNSDQLFEEALASYHLGFDGKQVIHPNQIDPVQKAFSPTLEDVMEAYSILKQFKRHEETGTAVFKRNGRMIDLPMVIAALRVYQRAARIELKSVKRKANGTRKI